MGKINCRGHENRISLCRQYKIVPEFRVKLLKGIVVSDSGGRITDELYIFSAYDQDEKFVDKIICGEPTAKDFLTLTGMDRPPLFNMLKTSPRSQNKSSEGVKKVVERAKNSQNPLYSKEDFSDWNPVNKALYEAIAILILVWQDTSGDSLLFRELRKCTRYPDKYPYSDRLMRLNTMLSKDYRGSLANILDSLKKAGNNLKEFDLQLLHDAVLKCGVESHIL